jgi:D-serine deaminase-like pyridoxal phosphate-dependent protein
MTSEHGRPGAIWQTSSLQKAVWARISNTDARLPEMVGTAEPNARDVSRALLQDFLNKEDLQQDGSACPTLSGGETQRLNWGNNP